MRVKEYIIACLFLCASLNTGAQSIHTIQGVVSDSAGIPLEGASIRIFSEKDTLAVLSKANGSFILERVDGKHLKLAVSLTGFDLFFKMIVADEKEIINMDTLFLSRKYQQLDSFTVKAIVPVTLKGDTIEYRASAFKGQPGDMVEDLIKKFPGITFDPDGKIIAQGKKIARITVNGKDFFGDDMQVALKNLPSEIVKNVQVIQDYGETSKFTGIKSGISIQVLNINTRDDKKKGHIGEVSGAMGFDGHYQLLGFATQFNKEDRVGINSSSDNIAPGGSSASINRQHSVAINYVDKWSDLLSGSGSFSYSQNAHNISSYSEQRSIFQNGSILNKTSGEVASNGSSELLNYTLQYSPDSSNNLSVKTVLANSPSNSNSINNFTIDQTDSLSKATTKGHSQVTTDSKNYSIGAELIFVHRFLKPWRVLSLNAYIDHGDSLLDNQNMTHSTFSTNGSVAVDSFLILKTLTDHRTNKRQIKVGYIEPIGKTIRLLFNYELGNERQVVNRNIFIPDLTGAIKVPVDSLSDLYHQTVVTQMAGCGISGSNAHLEYTINVSGLSTVLNGNSISKSVGARYSSFHIIPAVLANYKLTKSMSLMINYSVINSLPDYKQLLPVTDLSNPQYPVTGNPALKASFQHNLSLQFNKTNMTTGDLFTVVFGGIITRNSVVPNLTNRFNSPGDAGTVVQQTTYLNTNGIFSLNSSYNYSKSFFAGKLRAGLIGGIAFMNDISYVNNIRSINENWLWNQGGQLGIAIPKHMEVSVYMNYLSKKTNFGARSLINSRVSSLRFEVQGRVFFSPEFIFGYDGNKNFNKGFSNEVNSNPILVNTYLERWFQKRMFSIRLQCLNLLNQQTAISRTISGNIIVDSRVNQVGRYLMLLGSIRLSKFSGSKKGGLK